MKKEAQITKTTLILVITLLVLLAVFIVRPGIQGYGVYQQVSKTPYGLEEYGKNVAELERKLSTTKENLTLHSAFTEKIFSQVDTLSKELTQCLTDKAKAQASAQAAQTKIELLQEQFDTFKQQQQAELSIKEQEVQKESEQCFDELQAQKVEFQKVQEEHNIFIQNVARRICCKERVDNANIMYYDVLNNKLVCLEEGEKELEC